MRVLCFIPAYNEYSNLKSLISKIKKENYMIDEFLFIDSGSNDGSLDIIKKSGHKYISLNENRGLGYLFIKALDYSIQHNFDIFVVLSGNDKMNPADFQNILNPILLMGMILFRAAGLLRVEKLSILQNSEKLQFLY